MLSLDQFPLLLMKDLTVLQKDLIDAEIDWYFVENSFSFTFLLSYYIYF